MPKSNDLKNYVILKYITNFIVPFIILYALYIQINGEVSPGGGFQAGSIFGSGLIALSLVNDQVWVQKHFSIKLLIYTSTIGVIIYALIGVISLYWGENYLNYNALYTDKHIAQSIGIFGIEIGVGVTIASVMFLIYLISSDL